jgi:hypothetical protein
MRTKFATLLAVAAPLLAFAAIEDPIIDFKKGLIVPEGDKIMKWVCDLNGDGKNEVLLSLKSDLDKSAQDHQPPAWLIYMADPASRGYSASKGIELEAQTVDSVLADIDPETCFVGWITELGKQGIVTMRTDNPRRTESVGKIYTYTIEGDHLKRTELAQYVIAQGPHALFTKYLSHDKRTHVELEEINP